jgi:hypothetical protein
MTDLRYIIFQTILRLFVSYFGTTNYRGLGDPVTAASTLSSRLMSLCVTFKGNGKGFPSGISFPSDKVNVDVIESCGGEGVVNCGYGCTCRWVRVGAGGAPFLEGVAALRCATASSQA